MMAGRIFVNSIALNKKIINPYNSDNNIVFCHYFLLFFVTIVTLCKYCR